MKRRAFLGAVAAPIVLACALPPPETEPAPFGCDPTEEDWKKKRDLKVLMHWPEGGWCVRQHMDGWTEAEAFKVMTESLTPVTPYPGLLRIGVAAAAVLDENDKQLFSATTVLRVRCFGGCPIHKTAQL